MTELVRNDAEISKLPTVEVSEVEEVLLDFNIRDNPGVITKRNFNKYNADRSNYFGNDKLVIEIRDTGFIWGPNSTFNGRLVLGTKAPGASTVTPNVRIALSQTPAPAFISTGNEEGANTSLGHSVAAATIRRIVISSGGFVLVDEDFKHKLIAGMDRNMCTWDRLTTEGTVEGYRESLFEADTAQSRFALGAASLASDSFSIPLSKLSPFFASNRYIPFMLMKDSVRIELFLQNPVTAVNDRTANGTANANFEIINPNIILDSNKVAPGILEKILQQEKTVGVNYPYMSFIGRLKTASSTGKFLLDFNDSVSRGIALFATVSDSSLIDDIDEDFLKSTLYSNIANWSVRLNKFHLPSNGDVDSPSKAFTELMKAGLKLSNCQNPPAQNYNTDYRFEHLFLGMDLTRHVLGADGSSGIEIRPGDLQLEITFAAAPVMNAVWNVYMWLLHQKVLKIQNSTLQDAT